MIPKAAGRGPAVQSRCWTCPLLIWSTGKHPPAQSANAASLGRETAVTLNILRSNLQQLKKRDIFTIDVY
jgi:hypothetical protein